MKKILIFAVAALFAISASAQGIGRVNISELFMLMPDYMEAQRTFAAVNHETSITFKEMVNEYQKKGELYEKNKDVWTPAVRDAKEKELADIQRRLYEFQQTSNQELEQKSDELLAPVREKAIKTVRDLAKSQGLSVVFDVADLVYYDEENVVDLMPAARAALGIPEDRTLENVRVEINELQQKYEQ